MKRQAKKLYKGAPNWVALLFPLFLVTATPTAYGINEFLELYNAPQALALGNAMTADAQGYLSNYYNPAGLAKMPRRRMQLHLVALEGSTSLGGASRALDATSWGIPQLNQPLQQNPGDYAYFSYGAIPSISIRGFSVSVLARREYAAISDGTNLDIDARTDLGVTVGVARNFAGNLFKLGVSGKFLVRNQLKGTFAHSSLNGDSQVNSQMREGMGFGANVGALVTLPMKYLPTFGVVWKDVLGTRFSASNFLNELATGAPDTIEQSFNIGFSLNPRFTRLWRMRIAIDMRHLERSDLPLRKKLHVGVQLKSIKRKRRSFLWLGMNQLYFGGGVGVRLPGGDLEVGTYAVDIGAGETAESSRRFFMRYTVGF